MTTLSALVGELDAEYHDLRTVVAALPADDPAWDTPTPAEGWAVRDQISHLAFFDDAARRAVLEPDRFAAEAAALMVVGGDPMEVHLAPGRALDGEGLLSWWDGSHRGMIASFAHLDPATRVPWFGPPMGARSFVSARLMETWAHGQDVAEALGRQLLPTDRLRHVAHLGVRARPFSYLVHGREVPPGRIGVELAAPSGEQWRWEVGEEVEGPIADTNVATIEGPALDFCLVVTQRRNLVDTALVVHGDLALDWLSVAQAFAGPPGPGRPPR